MPASDGLVGCLSQPRPNHNFEETVRKRRETLRRLRPTVLLLSGRQRVVVVHAFVKKTQRTPDKELKLARKRVKELQDG